MMVLHTFVEGVKLLALIICVSVVLDVLEKI